MPSFQLRPELNEKGFPTLIQGAIVHMGTKYAGTTRLKMNNRYGYFSGGFPLGKTTHYTGGRWLGHSKSPLKIANLIYPARVNNQCYDFITDDGCLHVDSYADEAGIHGHGSNSIFKGLEHTIAGHLLRGSDGNYYAWYDMTDGIPNKTAHIFKPHEVLIVSSHVCKKGDLNFYQNPARYHKMPIPMLKRSFWYDLTMWRMGAGQRKLSESIYNPLDPRASHECWERKNDIGGSLFLPLWRYQSECLKPAMAELLKMSVVERDAILKGDGYDDFFNKHVESHPVFDVYYDGHEKKFFWHWDSNVILKNKG